MHTRNTRSKTASKSVEVPVEKVEKVSKVTKKPKAAKVQNTDALVASIISSIKEDNGKESPASIGNANEEINESPKDDAKKSVVKNKPNAVKPVRGLPRSGRPWKEVKQKFSTIKKSVKRRPFEKKEQLRHELKHIKELSNSIKEDKKQDNLAQKQRRVENAQRRLENERKSEVVQIIKNPAKLKRMKKKALRKIEKRDLDAGNGPKVLA